GGYNGPAALTVEVTDGTSLTDPAARVAVITIPVQVGPQTPVLHCPSDPLTVIEGGAPLDINVASVCHVWAADPGTVPAMRFTASWSKPLPGVALSGSGQHTIGLAADATAVPDATG